MRLQILITFALLGVLAACAAPTASPIVSPATPLPTTQPAAHSTAPPPVSVLACNASYAVPGKEFRSDDPGKLDAMMSRPKLVEFFAFW
jgi:uncharacterized lipoprotein YajG